MIFGSFDAEIQDLNCSKFDLSYFNAQVKPMDHALLITKSRFSDSILARKGIRKGRGNGNFSRGSK